MIEAVTKRRAALLAARTGAIGSAVMLAVSMWGLSSSGLAPAGAAVAAGAVVVVHPDDGSPEAGQPLEAGGSATAFSLLPPAGAACAGDSATDNYRVQSYVVGSAVDPATLTFDASGPVPAAIGAGFRQPLYDATTSGAYVDALTLENPGATRPRPGQLINVPAFSFAVFEPGNLPAGTYNVGLACTLGPPSATQVDRFWNVQLQVVADTGDAPAGVTWTVVEGTTDSATDGSTDGSTDGATDGTTDGSTDGATDGATDSATDGTTDGATDGTTDSATDGTTDGATDGTSDGATDQPIVEGGGVSTGSLVGGLGALPATGSSTAAMVGWGTCLLIFGRMAVLLARPVRVKPIP